MLIKGLSFTALRGCDPARWRSALKQIDERCEALSETMATVLAFAGRRKEPDLKTFRAADVVAQAERLLRPLALSKGVSLSAHVDEDMVFIGEPRPLVQALMNLGSNAVRACDGRGGRVTLHASRVDEGTCRLMVKDDGLGVPEYLRHRLFRPFVTSQAASEGTGLGLFLVRQTVRRMGGVIRVETSPAGTCVQLDLPATRPVPTDDTRQMVSDTSPALSAS
jgi:signal transduction histidine kinase